MRLNSELWPSTSGANSGCQAIGSSIAVPRRSLVVGLAFLPLAACGKRNPPRIELHIASDGDEMAFKPDHLYCQTGADVRLFFHNAEDILDDPHDWVLLKPGTEAAFVADADKSTSDTASIPPKDKDMVIAATPSCPKGKTVMVNFIAPAPGSYPFTCSFPGHGHTMHGSLVVTN
jgi:azurin